MEEYLRGVLGFKGERGYSAYETAVLNGFIGTEQDWLATLGTSSHFNEESIIHTSTAGQTSFNLPSSYTNNSFIDVYVNGLRLNSSEYTINTSTKKINLVGVTLTADQTVEIVVLTMSTNSLPITETINSKSTNETATGTKAVYDFVSGVETELNNKISETNTNLSEAEKAILDYMETFRQKFIDISNVSDISGNIPNIGAGATKTVDIAYPSGFTKDNTFIISKMSSSNNVYYDNISLEDTASGYPVISSIALTDSTIRVWMKNNNASEARIGYYKIGLMKI